LSQKWKLVDDAVVHHLNKILETYKKSHHQPTMNDNHIRKVFSLVSDYCLAVSDNHLEHSEQDPR
jgi:hypothetical protein